MPTTGLLGGAGSGNNHHFTGAHPTKAVGRSELGFLTAVIDVTRLGGEIGSGGAGGGPPMRLTEML